MPRLGASLSLRSFWIGLLFASACGSDSVGAPPPEGPPGSTVSYTPVVAPPDLPLPDEVVPAADSFVQTDDADRWIAETLDIQATPTRVIVVDKTNQPRDEIEFAPVALQIPSQPPAAYKVDIVAQSLQTAADQARGGDTIVVLPGEYRGFTIGGSDDAGDGRYIRFVAAGAPGAVKITGPSPSDPNWMIHLRAAHHIVLEGFHFVGQSTPGASKPGPWAGIFLNGDFRDTGEVTHHVAIVNVFAHNLKKWGLHSTDSHSVLIQDSVFIESGEQHGAYVSDGSDNYVIRRNVFQNNHQSGLQCNLDPVASLEELIAHPSMASFSAFVGERDWAEQVLDRADLVFGAGNYPDGKGTNFLIEQNVMTGNGRGGGGALNFATMSDSIIRNNLLYENFANGIVLWDDENPFDERTRESPSDTSAAKDPAKLPLFGSRDNLVVHNTVLMARPGRAALMIRNGATGTVAYNNVLINDLGPGIEIWDTSVWGLDVGNTITSNVALLGRCEDLAEVAVALPRNETDAATAVRIGASRGAFGAWVQRSSSSPWIVRSGDSWKLNPTRPNFQPRAGGALTQQVSEQHQADADLEGRLRKTAALGALAP